jgi:hypothetical protein
MLVRRIFAAIRDICLCTEYLFYGGLGKECPMQFALKMRAAAVRFGTEKCVGFLRLNAIFDSAAKYESYPCCGCGKPWGRVPRIMFGLARC